MPDVDFDMHQSKWKIPILLLFSVLLIIPSIIVGYQMRALWPPENERLSLLKEAQGLIYYYFLGDLPEQIELERGMIRGMLGEIEDPYTIYIEPAAFEIQADKLTGEYGGIGANLSIDDAGQYLLYPFEGSPASRVGVQDGDILVSVDGTAITKAFSQDEVLSLIRGPVGSEVVLTIQDRVSPGVEIEYIIEREMFPIPSVSNYLLEEDKRIAVIAISIFSDQTPREVEEAYDDLVNLGAQAFILDLRENSGGMLESAVEVARFFLREGTILFEQQKDEVLIPHDVESPGKAQHVPLVVVVDEATASSAEVVAAALQANDRASLIGRATFGKGSVQSVLVLKDGSSLYITSARWMTPDMEMLDQVGLQPDIVVSSDTENDEMFLSAAMEYLQDIIQGEL
jgi:carboxyl-terminal processing protease